VSSVPTRPTLASRPTLLTRPMLTSRRPLSFAVADLTADDGWDAALKGVDYVLHVASPLGGGTPDAMIAAARDGTLRVLRAATAAGVKRW